MSRSILKRNLFVKMLNTLLKSVEVAGEVSGMKHNSIKRPAFKTLVTSVQSSIKFAKDFIEVI